MWTLPSDAFTGTGVVSTNPATGVNFVSGLIPGGPVRACPASAGSMLTAASVPVSTTTVPSSDRSIRASRRYGVVIDFGSESIPPRPGSIARRRTVQKSDEGLTGVSENLSRHVSWPVVAVSLKTAKHLRLDVGIG